MPFPAASNRRANQLAAVVAAALIGLTALGCDSPATPAGGGEATIAFALPGGVALNSVNYSVFSSSDAVVASGTIDTHDPNATASVDIVLAPGTGDTVTLSAVTSTGLSCQGTSAPFDIASGQVTPVQVTLVCGGSSTPTGRGEVEITANLADVRCPSVTSGVVAPAQTSVGGQIQVSITASAMSPSDVLTFAWSPAANFAQPNANDTVFTCLSSGLQLLSVVIIDTSGSTPCGTTQTYPVTCI